MKEIEILRALWAYEKPNYTEKEIRDAIEKAIKALEAQGWIPVITKELSEEEIKFIEESDGFVDFDFGCDEWSSNMWKYESELPKDEQRILITTKEGWIDTDTFHRDERNLCWFEFYDNKDDVLAWMPLPEPYKKNGADMRGEKE